ncbi:MAG: methionine aminopeptidase [Lapillicoccus sp.]
MSYWYNVKTGQVEDDDNRGQGADVLGPYDSEADAAKALDTARDRTEKWDEEDREWGAMRSPRESGPPSAAGAAEDLEDLED